MDEQDLGTTCRPDPGYGITKISHFGGFTPCKEPLLALVFRSAILYVLVAQ